MYGHAPFHSALQLGHKYRELQRRATLSCPQKGCSPYTLDHLGVHLCARGFAFSRRWPAVGLRCMFGNAGKQNTCQMSWHFCSRNTNLGWQYETNPDTRPPSLHQSGRRQAAPPGWLLSLPLPLPLPPSDILTAGTGYQRQDTAILSPCLHWHPTAAADDQMGFWENIQQLFLHGTLSRKSQT